MLDYFSSKKSKGKGKQPDRRPSEPLLTDDDEDFLRKITSQVEGTPPPLPERPFDLNVAGETEGNDAQLVLANEAHAIPLPDVPDTPQDEVTSPKEPPKSPSSPSNPTRQTKRRWSPLPFGGKNRDRKATATGLDSAIADMKAAQASGEQAPTVPTPEAKKEGEEIEDVLEQLNLAAVNNRVFSFSDESRELIHK